MNSNIEALKNIRCMLTKKLNKLDKDYNNLYVRKQEYEKDVYIVYDDYELRCDADIDELYGVGRITMNKHDKLINELHQALEFTDEFKLNVMEDELKILRNILSNVEHTIKYEESKANKNVK